MDNYLKKIIFSIGVILFVFFISIITKRVLRLLFSRLNPKIKEKKFYPKTKTLLILLKNIIDISLSIITILIILSHWGVDISPLLTGAGILGLAFSFGAQSLVKDIISGFFIILEDQFNVGDYIKVAKLEGIVKKITIRSTVLENKEGNSIYIPNSQITTVVKNKK